MKINFHRLRPVAVQVLGGAIGVVLLTTATAAPAAAYTLRYWNSSSSPLTVKNEGGTNAGQAYGDWNIIVNTNGTRSRAGGYLKDLLPNNGYNVYFKLQTYTNAGVCVSPDYTSCNASYYYWAEGFPNNSKELWNQNYWSPKYYAGTDLNPNADYARAHMFVSESNNLGDPQAGPTITKGNAY